MARTPHIVVILAVLGAAALGAAYVSPVPAFLFDNIGIALGYSVVGLFILPRVTEFLRRLVPFVELDLFWTGVGGCLFFLTCGITHVEQALHLAFAPEETVAEMASSWHMQFNHHVQVAAVWTLILGSLFEFALPISRALTIREHR